MKCCMCRIMSCCIALCFVDCFILFYYVWSAALLHHILLHSVLHRFALFYFIISLLTFYSIQLYPRFSSLLSYHSILFNYADCSHLFCPIILCYSIMPTVLFSSSVLNLVGHSYNSSLIVALIKQIQFFLSINSHRCKIY